MLYFCHDRSVGSIGSVVGKCVPCEWLASKVFLWAIRDPLKPTVIIRLNGPIEIDDVSGC